MSKHDRSERKEAVTHTALSTRKQTSTPHTARRPFSFAHQLMTGNSMYTTGHKLIRAR